MAKKLSSNLFKVSIAPENGADATTYWLVPSVTQVKRKADGSHLPEYVSCECFSKTGDGNPVSGGGTIKFVLTYKTGSNSAEFVYGSRIIVTSDMAAISFRLYVGGTKVDEKTVAVVEDGSDGLPGPAGMRGRMPFPSGAFDLLTTYTATDAITPIVYYEAGKMYYVMNKSVSVTGLNPAEDYAANGSNATWIPFENYTAIFTEILMANFAKLASAVFYGDYMFSQHGKNASGNDTIDYGMFDPAKIGQSDCPFTPNLMMDLLKGKFLGDNVELRGGDIGGWHIDESSIYSDPVRISGDYFSGDNITRLNRDGTVESLLFKFGLGDGFIKNSHNGSELVKWEKSSIVTRAICRKTFVETGGVQMNTEGDIDYRFIENRDWYGSDSIIVQHITTLDKVNDRVSLFALPNTLDIAGATFTIYVDPEYGSYSTGWYCNAVRLVYGNNGAEIGYGSNVNNTSLGTFFGKDGLGLTSRYLVRRNGIVRCTAVARNGINGEKYIVWYVDETSRV